MQLMTIQIQKYVLPHLEYIPYEAVWSLKITAKIDIGLRKYYSKNKHDSQWLGESK